jgi:hypothetical protein
MRLHPHAAALFATADPDWRRKIFRGGLLLLVPTLGWPTILGYRTALVRHLFESDVPTPLPPWSGRVSEYFVEGIKAVGVIFGYLSPLFALLAAIVTARGYVPGAPAALLLLFFLAFPIFSTLSFPTACVVFAHQSRITTSECGMLVGAYALVVFLIPAGFLRVSLTGRHLSAFQLWRTLPFLKRNLVPYVKAWWHSGIMSLFGHLALPFSPWGVVWAYLAIIFLFNEILVLTGARAGPGWLRASLEDRRFAGRGRVGTGHLEDGRGEDVTVLDLRGFSVPLPRLLSSRT